jgi:hypothetical protein
MNNHTILFFDDWLLDSHQGLVRRWPKPRPVGEPYSDPYSPSGCGYPSVEYDPETGLWRAWSFVSPPDDDYRENPPDIGNRVTVLWESDDGLNWRPLEGKNKGALQGAWPHVVFNKAVEGCGQIYRDPVDPDPERRYKMAAVIWAGRDPEGKSHLGQRYELRLFTSPDGISWQEGSRIHGLSSDTYHSFTYDPLCERYRLILRANTPDRRVWMTFSKDAVTWDRPQLILSPDPADPPCVQFYGMPHFQYDDYTIGLLWLFHTQYGEPDPVKRKGSVDTHLAYSLNGVAWNRTVREPFIPLGDPGSQAAGSVYACSLVPYPQGRLRIYAIAHGGQHGASSHGALAAYEMRRDGFVCLRPEGYSGTLTTRAIVPTDGCLSINAQAPCGEIRIEVLDASESPIPGFSGQNAAIFSGDETEWRVAWPSADFSTLKGHRVKLRVSLSDSELYAIRFQGYFAYSHTALASLDGTSPGPTLLPLDGREVFV